MISRLEAGQMSDISIEALYRVLCYGQENGYSLDFILFHQSPLNNASVDDLKQALLSRAANAYLAEDADLKHKMAGPIGVEKTMRLLAFMDELAVSGKLPEPSALQGRPVPLESTRPLSKDHRIPRQSPDANGPVFQVTRTIERGFHVVSREEIYLPDGQIGDRWQAGGFIPILGRLAAGEGIDTIEAEAHPPGWADTYLIYRDKPVPTGAFALRISGDSMEPDYHDGDMVVVDGGRQVTDGVCCVIYQTDGERLARLKVLHRTKRTVTLSSTNKEYPPTKIPPKNLIAAYAITDHLPQIVELPAGKE